MPAAALTGNDERAMLSVHKCPKCGALPHVVGDVWHQTHANGFGNVVRRHEKRQCLICDTHYETSELVRNAP
jgi:hypothetical protein